MLLEQHKLNDYLKNHRNVCLLIFVFLIQSFSHFTNANPQDYRYRKAFMVQRLSLDEGLSQSVVNSIVQDSDGYMWLATEDGLNRFDSYQFKIFRHDHQKKNSLHENWVSSIIEEPGFGLWVGTIAGLSFFNPQDESFTNYSLINSDLNGWTYDFIYSQESVVWIASAKGLFYVDRNKNKVLPFISSNGKNIKGEVFSLTESNDFIYVATSTCIYQIEKNTNKTLDLCNREVLKKFKKSSLNVLAFQDNELWIGTRQGLYRYDVVMDELSLYQHKKNDPYSISNNAIKDIVFDKDNLLWVATEKGLNRYDKRKQIFERYAQEIFPEEGLSENDLVSIYVDDQDLIWIGTYGGGVNILDPAKHQFEHLLSRSDVIDIGGNNMIYGIEKDNNEVLWLASYGGGLIAYDLLTGKITRPLNDAGIDYDNYVHSLLIDHSDRLWVGTLKKLLLIDIEKKQPIKVRFTIGGKRVENIDNIMRVHEDHQGNIWLGSENGLFKVTDSQMNADQLEIEIKDFTYKIPQTFTNYSTRISTIINDQNGDFWMGGYAGLLHYKASQEKWEHYQYDRNNPQSLSNNNVQVIYEDSFGFLWVGTADGLNRVKRSKTDPDLLYFQRITTYQGLPNNTIYGILEDQKHQLWLSTTLGLVKYTNNVDNVDVFKRIDGLSSDEFNIGAYFADNQNKLYFGSINGITLVNNETDDRKINRGKIFFSMVTVGNRNIDTYQLNHAEYPRITQQSDEVAIDLSVANINFDKLGTQRYRYRILGLDERWNYLGVGHNLFIAGLPEGRYQLDIESKLLGQKWLAQSSKLEILVKTDFWRSSTAYYLMLSFSFVFFLFCLFLVAKFYQKRIKKTNKRMIVERLKVKELHADNDSLKFFLQGQQNEVIALNEQLKHVNEKLGVEKYRDATTGFYWLNYLEQLNENVQFEKDGITSLSGFDCYHSLAVFELNDYSKINRNFGHLAAAEMLAKIAMILRQKTASQTHVFCIQSGMFLILSGQNDKALFFDSMVNLRYQIMRHEFEIANGVSVNSNVALSLMDVSDSEIITKKELIAMINLIIQAHRFYFTKNEQSSIEIEVSRKANYFVKQNKKTDLEKLQKNNQIQLKNYDRG